MSSWVYKEIERLSRQCKELLSISIYQPWNRETQTEDKKLVLGCDLSGFETSEIEAIRQDLRIAIERTTARHVRNKKQKIQRRLNKL